MTNLKILRESTTKTPSDSQVVSEGFWMTASKKEYSFGSGAPGNSRNLKKLNDMLLDSKGVVTTQIMDFLYTWNPKQGQYPESAWVFVARCSDMSRKKIKFVSKKDRNDKEYYVEL